MKSIVPLFLMFGPLLAFAQKKPLDHTVYDSWQSIGERKISPNGQWAVYTIDVQEGDGQLVIQSTNGSDGRFYPRGYGAVISNDSRYAVFRIKAPFADTRQAKIKKKKPDEMPKDSLAIVDLQSGVVYKTARVKGFRIPEKGEAWVAMHMEKALSDTTKKPVDSLSRKVDSTKLQIPTVVEQKPDRKRKQKWSVKEDADPQEDADGDEAGAASAEQGTELVVRNLVNGESFHFNDVTDFLWSRNGKMLVIEGSANKADKKSLATLSVFRSLEGRADTISRGAGDYRNFAVDDDASMVAFTAERDSSAKSLQKFYKLWLWKNGTDSARMIADRSMVGMPLNWTISENGILSFSKNGDRLFFGTAPVRAPKDTNLVEIDMVKLDVWHYNDDYLQPQQLKNLDLELKRSYAAVYLLPEGSIVQLGDMEIPQVVTANEGNGNIALGITDKGKRIQGQWEGRTLKDLYAIDLQTGNRILVTTDLVGNGQISPEGKYIFWYDAKAKQYRTWHDGKIYKVSDGAKVMWHQEDFDMPDYPTPYGLMRWMENDAALLVYDRYDIWKLDPQGLKQPINITQGAGRKSGVTYRYMVTDPEERFVKEHQDLILRSFNNRTKSSGYATLAVSGCCDIKPLQIGDFSLGMPLKARDTSMFLYSSETFQHSADLYASANLAAGKRLTRINQQQSLYSWGRAELFTWRAYNGKDATGIVYLPEGFEPGKKYPMIAYFYKKLSDGLHTYMAPAPTPSRLNIPFFVSRGYVVFAPDIAYTTGYPGKAAFDYVVSGARALARKGWVDSTRMGLQGQSWGGYQVAHIITRTKLFKAAWAGAPVANMTSAYGGIRWESGLNRQFQYEHSQSRLGATLWEKPNLYIENSPLFHLKQVQTPLVIMSNDADGAVPWYQGIEMYTAMRRLGKKVWLLNYNGEAHNLVERRNRKDIQIREQQYFDWLLKGEKPAPWITDGVPATEKGRSWGLN